MNKKVEEGLMRLKRHLKVPAWTLVLLLGALGGAAQAAGVITQKANLDLQVTFTGSLSVSIDGQSYSTRTVSAGSNALVVASSATVVNTSNGLTESWQLTVSSVSGGGDWGVVGTTQAPPDVDQYAFQALFTSSATTLGNQPAGWANGCPTANASDWDAFASTVTGTSALYNTGMYADSTSIGGATGRPDVVTGISNGNMLAASSAPDGRGVRGLCTRIYMPLGTDVINVPQVIRLTVTAGPGN